MLTVIHVRDLDLARRAFAEAAAERLMAAGREKLARETALYQGAIDQADRHEAKRHALSVEATTLTDLANQLRQAPRAA